MKPIFFIAFECCLLFCLSCNENMLPSLNKTITDKYCKDSLLAYKTIILPGAQQTDLDGNVQHKKIMAYRVYLLSTSKNIRVDSIQSGGKKLANLVASRVEKTPVYWNGENGKLLLPKTNCAAYEITASLETTLSQSAEDEMGLTVHYTTNGLPYILFVKQVELLPPMVTQ